MLCLICVQQLKGTKEHTTVSGMESRDNIFPILFHYRAIGVNKDQPNSVVQPQVNPSTRNERNIEAPIRKSSEIHHLAPRDRTQALQYRNLGVKKDQTSSAVQPEVSSSARNEKNTEAPVRKSSEIHHLAPRDKTQVLQYRTIGGKKDQHSSALQPEARSSISKDRNTEAPVNKISEIHHLAPRDKTQILHCPPSLKRKALNQVYTSTRIFLSSYFMHIFC